VDVVIGEDVVASASHGASPSVPVTLTLRLEPLQLARVEVLIDALRRHGHRGSREEVLLAALELAVDGVGRSDAATPASSGASGSGAGGSGAGASTSGEPGPHTSVSRQSSRYRIVVAECPSCRKRRIAASDRPLDAATSGAVACDAERVDERGRRRSAIPPSVRRRVLARDGHRCRARGCGRRTLLEIHHRVPVSRGGTHDPANLVTLCHGCHQALHAMPGTGADDATAAPGCRPESACHPRDRRPGRLKCASAGRILRGQGRGGGRGAPVDAVGGIPGCPGDHLDAM